MVMSGKCHLHEREGEGRRARKINWGWKGEERREGHSGRGRGRIRFFGLFCLLIKFKWLTVDVNHVYTVIKMTALGCQFSHLKFQI